MSRQSPTIQYNPDGDLIEVFWESVEFYGDWICHGLVLYRARDDNRIVGCCIEGISLLVRKSETLEESLASRPIPVEERLPETSGLVLAWFQDCEDWRLADCCMADGKGHWSVINLYEGYLACEPPVAWLPLPPPVPPDVQNHPTP